MKKNKRQRKRPRFKKPSPPTVEQVFTRIELSDIAIQKLYFDEPLLDDELQALFESDYLQPSKSQTTEAQTLYDPNKLGIALASPILFSNIELEMLAYFGRHPELLHSLPPRKFEELVATVFRNNGFDVELTPETRDGGVDIFAVQKNDFAGSILHLVECKRYARDNKVGIGVLQRMLGVVDHHRATKGVIVTTSSFSRDAELFAEKSQYRLGLGDYTDLSSWLNNFVKN